MVERGRESKNEIKIQPLPLNRIYFQRETNKPNTRTTKPPESKNYLVEIDLVCVDDSNTNIRPLSTFYPLWAKTSYILSIQLWKVWSKVSQTIHGYRFILFLFPKNRKTDRWGILCQSVFGECLFEWKRNRCSLLYLHWVYTIW